MEQDIRYVLFIRYLLYSFKTLAKTSLQNHLVPNRVRTKRSCSSLDKGTSVLAFAGLIGIKEGDRNVSQRDWYKNLAYFYAAVEENTLKCGSPSTEKSIIPGTPNLPVKHRMFVLTFRKAV